MKVTVHIINGRTCVDIVDLIAAISNTPGRVLSKETLLNQLWRLDEQGQATKK